MKKIKILILFLIIIVLTGCNSHYDLTINKDLTVNEEASLAPDYGFLYDIKVTSKEYFEEVYNSEKKELLDSNGYTHRISDDNNSILKYKYGYKDFGRIPMQFEYSGYAILSSAVPPSDKTAKLIELNNKEETRMGEQEIKAIVSQAIDEMNAHIAEINEVPDPVN